MERITKISAVCYNHLDKEKPFFIVVWVVYMPFFVRFLSNFEAQKQFLIYLDRCNNIHLDYPRNELARLQFKLDHINQQWEPGEVDYD